MTYNKSFQKLSEMQYKHAEPDQSQETESTIQLTTHFEYLPDTISNTIQTTVKRAQHIRDIAMLPVNVDFDGNNLDITDRDLAEVMNRLDMLEAEVEVVQMNQTSVREEEGIDGNFDSEKELVALLNLPRTDRKKALSTFKKRLAKQRYGIARLTISIMDAILREPNLTNEEFDSTMSSRVNYYTERYQLSEDQQELYSKAFILYKYRHQAIRTYRDKYPEDKELVRMILNFSPQGKVRINEGPMTLRIMFYNQEDFYRNTGQMTHPHKSHVAHGALLQTTAVQELNHAIVLVNAGIQSNEQIAKTIIHEDRHAIDSIIHKILPASNHSKISSLHRTLNEKLSLEQKKYFLRQYIQSIRTTTEEERTKDEIAAYFSEGYEPITIIKQLTEHNGLYDYLKWLRDASKTHILTDGHEELQKIIELEAGDIYHRHIADAVYALYDMQEFMGSRDKAWAILYTNPLRTWKKTAQRIMSQT